MQTFNAESIDPEWMLNFTRKFISHTKQVS